MSKITYDDKVALNVNSNIADINKVNASDMNEIKQVVNDNANTLDNLLSNTYGTSQTEGYSQDYINRLLLKENYEITDMPIHSSGTNVYQLNKLNKLVIINVDTIWFNSITANSWLNIGQLPSELYPLQEITTNCVITDGTNGNVVGYARIIITTAGLIRIKSSSTTNVLTSCGFSASWVID